MKSIGDDLNEVKNDFEACIHWLRRIHIQARLVATRLEEIYHGVKRHKISPAEAVEIIRREGLDVTPTNGGAR
jgi:hypothetical protein